MNPKAYDLVKSRIMAAGTKGTTPDRLARDLAGETITAEDINWIIGDLDQQELLVRRGGFVWWGRPVLGRRTTPPPPPPAAEPPPKREPPPTKIKGPLKRDERHTLIVGILSDCIEGMRPNEIHAALKNRNVLVSDFTIYTDLQYLAAKGKLVKTGQTRATLYYHPEWAPQTAPRPSKPKPAPDEETSPSPHQMREALLRVSGSLRTAADALDGLFKGID